MSSDLKGLFGGGGEKADQASGTAPSGGESPLSGLFGGAGGEQHKAAVQDFIQRVQTGAPHEGFSTKEALERLAQARQQTSPEQFQEATRKAVANLPENQRAEFARMLQQRMAGVDRGGTAAMQGGNASADDISGMLTQILGGGGGGGLLGGLLGGGGSGGLLGGLLGGSEADNKATQGSAHDGGLDDLLGGLFGSPAGKAALGGIAAMVLSQLMGNKHGG